jgi:predicted PurR-regulated permease PerM
MTPRTVKDEPRNKTMQMINISLIIIVTFLCGWILILGKSIILPFMVALFMSFLFNPLMSRLVRWKFPAPLALTLTLFTAFLILYLLGMLIYSNIQLFAEQFPVYQEKVIGFLKDFSTQYEEWSGKPFNWKFSENIDWIGTLQNSPVTGGLLSGVGAFFSVAGNLVMVIIFMAYLLAGRRKLSLKIHHAFSKEKAGQMVAIFENVTDQIQRYMIAKTIISLASAILCIIVFYSFGLDFAIFWGFIIFILNYIPNIGSAISTIMPILFGMFQFASFSRALWMSIVLMLVQMISGNIIEPKFMGKSLNLSPLMVILFLIFWGFIWGITGMILAVPILVAFTIIVENVDSLRFLSVFLRQDITRN